MRVAQHQPVFGIPQHEGFRDRFDRIAQPQVGLHAALGKAALLGDVDGNADQVQAAFADTPVELASHP